MWQQKGMERGKGNIRLPPLCIPFATACLRQVLGAETSNSYQAADYLLAALSDGSGEGGFRGLHVFVPWGSTEAIKLK